MRLSMNTAALVASLFTLPSCGGSASPQTAVTVAQSFQSRLDNYNDQATRLRSLAPTIVMPKQGSATYNGTIGVSGIQNFSQPEAVGDIVLVANFDSAAISGTLGGFNSPAGALSGPPLNLSNGFIAGNQIIADVSGENPLAPAGGNISGSIQGSFLGANATALAGTFVGSNSSGSLYGRFGAER